MLRKTNVYDGERFDFASHINEFLIRREDAQSLEAFLVIVEPGKSTHMHNHLEMEQVFFVIGGKGKILTDDSDECLLINRNDIIFIPQSHYHQICCIGDKPLQYLTFNSFVDFQNRFSTSFKHASNVIERYAMDVNVSSKETAVTWRNPILIAGSSGYIGSALTRFYLEMRQNVWAYDNHVLPDSTVALSPFLSQRNIDLLCELDLFKAFKDDCQAMQTIPSLLIANVGAPDVHLSFLETDANTVISQFNKNFIANYNIARVYSQELIAKNKHGTIIFIGSVGARKAHRNQCIYDASKAAIEGFTRSIALELAPFNVNVNTIALGPIDGSPSSEKDVANRDSLRQLVPIGRYGNLDEVVEIISQISAIESPYFTGQTITIDGGLSIQLRPAEIERISD